MLKIQLVTLQYTRSKGNRDLLHDKGSVVLIQFVLKTVGILTKDIL